MGWATGNDTTKGARCEVLRGIEHDAALSLLAAAGHLGVVGSHCEGAWLERTKREVDKCK